MLYNKKLSENLTDGTKLLVTEKKEFAYREQ